LCHISEVQESRDQDDLFDEDLSNSIDEAKNVAKGHGFVMYDKGGKINKDTYLRITYGVG
jgi:hypothetical protein